MKNISSNPHDVYVFWLGGGKPKKIERWQEKFPNLNFIIGPSNKEHKFLMDNYPYYRNSFNIGTFSFCSDIWRFYVLGSKKGLYIDTSVNLGPKFESFVTKYYDKGPILFKEKQLNLASCVLFGPLSSQPLDLMKGFDKIPRLHPVAPFVLDHVGYKESSKISLLEIRNKETIFKYGQGSWNFAGPESAKRYWNNLELLWRKGEIPVGKIEDLDKINIMSLRVLYDRTLNSIELRNLANEYKEYKRHNKIKIGERLIWSQFYRLFTGKTFLTKKGKNETI